MKDRISNPGYNWQKAQEQRIAAKNRVLGKESPAPAPTLRVTEKAHRQATKAQQFLNHYGGQPMPKLDVNDKSFQSLMDAQLERYRKAVNSDLMNSLFKPNPLMERLKQEYPTPSVWDLDVVGEHSVPHSCMWCAAEFATVDELESHEEGCL